jgi:preprotein translocase subunit SecF
MTATIEPTVKKRSIWTRLYHGETEYDFIGKWKLWFAISGVFILIGMGAFVAHGGLNLGIDFTGGNVWQIPSNDTSVSDVEDALAGIGINDTKVQTVGGDLRIQTPYFEGTAAQRDEREQQVVTTLADLSGSTKAQVEADQNTVGPTWGKEISSKAIRALIIFFVLISIYITLRFELKMAIGTLAALVHDLLVVVGAYAILQLPVTPATVIAILTILGFSIYDGIVVFDRVDENTRLLSAGARMTYTEMTNLSLNQVLMRSLNTQITALLPIISVLVVGSLILGATTLQEFGLALFLGQLSGAYSSIFIASPVLALLKEREPRYVALRKRLEERESRDRSRGELEAELATAQDSPGEPTADGGSTKATKVTKSATATKASTPARSGSSRPGTYSANHPPRPRKKGKRR